MATGKTGATRTDEGVARLVFRRGARCLLLFLFAGCLEDIERVFERKLSVGNIIHGYILLYKSFVNFVGFRC